MYEINNYIMIMFAKVLESDEYKKEHYSSLTLCVETKRKPETFITIKSLSCLFVCFDYCCSLSFSRIFDSFGDVNIAGEEIYIKTICSMLKIEL